ncbi:MAG TPA: hypothetical protein P5567_01690 [Kiritimatiellia bacterium]|nr:hypothetical protein [Kiritimatiellia bacterium]HRZ11147.1 hypothetical protein [Kiritimatiellia bacterium]HSA19481.1 hypothetical protein [Kiritimatiellia bacterium]
MRARHAIAGTAILLGAALGAFAQTPAEPGVGPALVLTKDGQFPARLLRRDQEMLWVSKSTEDGSAFEAGIPLADIQKIRMPSPRVFAAADVAANDEQFRAVHDALDRLIQSLKPFRGLPGVPMDEAILRKGQLYARQGLWREAIRQYEDILKQPYECEQKTAARLRAGIASELAGDAKAALTYFENVVLPEDDEELLSTALFSRANALAADGRPQDALLDYLRLVVFHPYMQNNELRGLEAAVGCYAQLKDWESLHKTVAVLQQDYPGTRESKHAAEVEAEHRAEMEAAGTVLDEGATVEPEGEPSAAAASTSAPPVRADTETIQAD